MGLKTGGQSAVPTKENKERTRLAIHAEKTRQIEMKIDENAAAEKHEAEENYSKTILSKDQSKIESEKKPMKIQEEEKKTNELCETQTFRESTITNNEQGTIERIEISKRMDNHFAKMTEYLEAIRDALIQRNLINCT